MTWEERWYGPKKFRPADLLLAPLSWGYRAGVAVKNGLYDAGLLTPRQVPGATVVCVGNVTVGGAGKTPVVIFLVQWALAAGRRVAVVSRGYGREEKAELSFDAKLLPSARTAGDEPRLIAARCPGARVWVGSDRARLVARAVEQGAELVVLDDGFQHRGLARTVNVAVVDGLPNRQLLPFGPLREPVSALGRADVVWLRDGELPDVEPSKLVRAQHLTVPEPSLRGQKVVALAAVARPLKFLKSIEAQGAEVVARRFFADHHAFTPAELAEVQAVATAQGARIVTTEKDLQRLPDGFPATVLKLEVAVLSGLPLLSERLALPMASVPRVWSPP